MLNRINPYRYSRKIIYKYLKAFLKEREDVSDSGDIEVVHRMRVASRRLRAALSVFKVIIPAKKTKVWRKEIRKIGRALGRARQLDVQIKFLEAAKQRIKNNSRIVQIQEVIKSLKDKRRKAQRQIDIALEGFEIKKRLLGLTAYLDKLAFGKRGDFRGRFSILKGVVIRKRLDKLLKFAPYVFRPQSKKELHRMRIAAKKLRYALEIFRPWYGAKLDKYIRASRDIQDSLGDFREFDCLIVTLSDFSNKSGKDFKDTVVYLANECARERLGAYIKFVRIWNGLQKKQLWVKLKKEV